MLSFEFQDWERADESKWRIFCKRKNSSEDGPLAKIAKAGASLAVPKKAKIDN